MTILWILSGVSLLAAVLLWIRARRTANRLEELSQQYWQLRYETGELRVELERLAAPSRSPGGSSGPAAAAPITAEAFVPLEALKR
jgi:hypothetical protein